MPTGGEDKSGGPPHPSELTDPCCLPALGGLMRWTPRGSVEESTALALLPGNSQSTRSPLRLLARRSAQLKSTGKFGADPSGLLLGLTDPSPYRRAGLAVAKALERGATGQFRRQILRRDIG